MRTRIRPFDDDDTGAVVEFSLRAWEPVFESIEGAMGSDIFLRLHPDWRAEQRRAIEFACASTRVWVAEAEGSVVGFVAVELHHEKRLGEIHMLAVAPEFHGRGIGTELTDFALARMKEAGMSVAMVETGGDPGHAAARRTYEKAGCSPLPISRYFKNL